MHGMARRLQCMRQELAVEFSAADGAPALNRSWRTRKLPQTEWR